VHLAFVFERFFCIKIGTPPGRAKLLCTSIAKKPAMEELGLISSPLIDHEIAEDKRIAHPEWEPGPDLERPRRRKCAVSILKYILRFNFIRIFIMLSALVVLIFLVLTWDELRPPVHSQGLVPIFQEVIQDVKSILHSSLFFLNGNAASTASPFTWVGWLINIQALLGAGTLLVALFVWYGEIHEDWENILPKRMSVFFLHNGLPVIVCRYVWLAGEGDLRAWGQQVAAQAVGERFLSFYPNVRLEAPRKALWIDGKICRHYEVCFELMDMDKKKNQNLFLAKYAGKCRYQNMATGSNVVRSVPIADLKNRIKAEVFPFNWPEKSNPDLSDAGIQTQSPQTSSTSPTAHSRLWVATTTAPSWGIVKGDCRRALSVEEVERHAAPPDRRSPLDDDQGPAGS